MIRPRRPRKLEQTCSRQSKSTRETFTRRYWRRPDTGGIGLPNEILLNRSYFFVFVFTENTYLVFLKRYRAFKICGYHSTDGIISEQKKKKRLSI